MSDDLIVAEWEVDLSVVDAKDVEDIKAKEQRKQRVMELIKEEGLDTDEELMKEVREAFDGILEIQK